MKKWDVCLMKSAENIRYFVDSNGYLLSQTDVNNGADYDHDTIIRGIPRPSDQRINFAIFFQDYIPFIPSFKVNLRLKRGRQRPFGGSRQRLVRSVRSVFRWNSQKCLPAIIRRLSAQHTSLDLPLYFCRSLNP